MARKDREKAEQEPATPSPEGRSTRITPIDIQQKEFRLAFRGYNEREVDEFLDQLTEEVARLHADNRRLQEQVEFHRTEPLGAAAAVGVGAVPGGGQGDERAGADEALQQARAEADRILAEARDQGDRDVQQARAQAARIVADAEARASSAQGPGVAAEPSVAGRGVAADPSSGGAGSARDQSAMRFLAREREFLQSLAGLIQRHAEAVKEDARSARRAAGPTAPTAGPAGTSPSEASSPAGPPETSQPAGYSAPPTAGTEAPASTGSVDAPQGREPETWPPPPNGGGVEATVAGEPSPAVSDAGLHGSDSTAGTGPEGGAPAGTGPDSTQGSSWASSPDPTSGPAAGRGPDAGAGGPSRFAMAGGEEVAADPTRTMGSVVATTSEERDPAPSSPGREEDEAHAGFMPAEPDRDDGEDRSLRELFWGEE